jgi:heme-degrading monooxygenase HmoA
MIARVTLAEVDVLRTNLDDAVELYRQSVLPELEEQDGYAGCYVLTTDEGKALVVTFWDSPETAQAGLASGVWAAQVEKFLTFYRAAPGRETYDVAIAAPPALATAEGTPP